MIERARPTLSHVRSRDRRSVRTAERISVGRTESTAATLAGRISRHALLYAVGAGLLVSVGLATLAVFTRLMPPAEFGKLVVLIALASGLSMLLNLATLQGTIGLVFGKGEEDGVSPDDDDAVPEAPQTEAGQREVLGTGLLLTATVATAATVALWAGAPGLSRLLFGTPADAGAIRLAGVAGALGALWRILLAVPRFERRPRVFVSFSVARPILALAVAIPLVSGGGGAEAALTGLIVATASLATIVLLLLRRAYRLRFHARLVPAIVRRGRVFVPLVLSMYVIGHGGVLLLSGVVPRGQIGLYGVAATLGGGISTLAAVFFMALLPMKRTSLFRAVYKERGHGWMFSTLTTYFLALIGLALVGLTAASAPLASIASPEYSRAATLIPALGAAAVAHAGFLLAYRISAFPRKRLALGGVSALAAVSFVGTAYVLVRALGVYGVPVAGFAAFLAAAGGMLFLNQRGARAIPFDRRGLAAIAISASACVGVHSALSGSAGSARPLLDIGTALAYPALLLLSRAISVSEVATLLRVGRDGLAERRRGRAGLVVPLAVAPADQAEVLRAAARPGEGRDNGDPEPGRVVAALRRITAAGPPTKRDDAIGHYLLSDLSRAERDALARALWRQGVSPAELDCLEQAFTELVGLPLHAWPTPEQPASAFAGTVAGSLNADSPTESGLRSRPHRRRLR